jgi:hypothetical protein
MAGEREHLELAVSLRALARHTDLPSARRALIYLAKRFDRMAARYGAVTGTQTGRPELQAHVAAAGALIVRGPSGVKLRAVRLPVVGPRALRLSRCFGHKPSAGSSRKFEWQSSTSDAYCWPHSSPQAAIAEPGDIAHVRRSR